MDLHNKSYSEMKKIDSFKSRLEYLKLLDNNESSPRHMSEQFYKSHAWRTLRKMIIDRDMGFDLGVVGAYIEGPVLIHHINPISEYDIVNQTSKLLDPENLICVSIKTHNMIHYNQKTKTEWVERVPGDTKLW